MIGFFKRSRRPKPPPLIPQRSRPRNERRAALPNTPVRTDGTFRRAIETGRSRLLITAAVMAFGFVAVAARLVDLAALTPPETASRPAYALSAGDLETQRATITDRNGTLVATSLLTTALAARPQRMLDPLGAARDLAALLPDTDADDLYARFTSGSPFVYVHRRVTPRLEAAILELGIPGLEFERTESRVYPHGNLMAHILGYTDVDGNGIAGIERGEDGVIRGSDEPVRLSIDLNFQHIVHSELSQAVERFEAIGGTAIVLKVDTGEVMAMVSLPDFDPNHPGAATDDQQFNRATLGVYELGSTFKIFNTAMALESGITDMDEGFDATDPIRVGRFTIRDYHARERFLTVPEIFIYSSNIGSAHMATAVGPIAQRSFMEQLGMLDRLDLELPETESPLYPSPWRPVNTMTIAYGHGLSVTPMHLASGVATMINGGIRIEPTFLARNQAPQGSRVISEDVSLDIRRLMRLNAVEGSGSQALVPGYFVGGKTGTAEKPDASGYRERALISSFVAAFPMNDPEYVVYVVLDEPQGNEDTFGYATGGWVAAPAAGAIIEQIAAVAGIQPIDENAPEIERVFAIELPDESATLASLRQ